MDAFPLSWPASYQRTPIASRQRSPFKVSFMMAVVDVNRQLKLMGANAVVISTNIPLRRDGLPYGSSSMPKDPGVAVYFQHRGRPVVLACDKWLRVEENMRAISLTLDAMRGLDRWGVSELLDRVFRGFIALPAPAPEEAWHQVLGVTEGAPLAHIEKTYRDRAKNAHPDRQGGSVDQMERLNRAIEQARTARGP